MLAYRHAGAVPMNRAIGTADAVHGHTNAVVSMTGTRDEWMAKLRPVFRSGLRGRGTRKNQNTRRKPERFPAGDGWCNRTRWLRGRDSNPRPLGYEPNELPLLHPATGLAIHHAVVSPVRCVVLCCVVLCCVVSGSATRPRARARARARTEQTERGDVRGGLASQAVAHPVLSGAALGHDRVRDGTGWIQRALDHEHPPASSAAARADSPMTLGTAWRTDVVHQCE